MSMNKIFPAIAVTLFLWTSSSRVLAQEYMADPLSHYIGIAIGNNPGIKSRQYTHEAFLEKIPQAGAYEDLELDIEAYTTPMDIIGGRSIGNVSLMQMLPWFGTRKAARTEAGHMANMQDQQYRESVNDLIFQVSTQWYGMQKLNEQLRNNEENRRLLVQLEQLALRKFSAPPSSGGSGVVSSNTVTISPTPSGSGGMNMGSGTTTKAASNRSVTSASGMTTGASSGMSDVLRIQLELIEIDSNIESLHALIKTEKIKFNTLLNREATSEVSLGEEIRKVDFLYNEKEALDGIEANNPMLGMITEEGLAYKAKAEMDRKMGYPMLGLGLQYMVVGKNNDPMFAMGDMNGKDMIMPMLSLSLPIFRKKYDARQKEYQLWWKASEENYNNTLNTLRSAYYGFKNQLDETERILRLYDKQSTLAHTTYNLIIKEFVVGKSDLTNVIQVQRQLLDYRLKKAEAIADYNTVVAAINKLVADNK